MWSNVLQALIVAGVTAALSAYVNAKVLDVKLNGLKDRLEKAEDEIDTLRKRLHDWAGHMGWVENERRAEYNRRHEDRG